MKRSFRTEQPWPVCGCGRGSVRDRPQLFTHHQGRKFTSSGPVSDRARLGCGRGSVRDRPQLFTHHQGRKFLAPGRSPTVPVWAAVVARSETGHSCLHTTKNENSLAPDGLIGAFRPKLRRPCPLGGSVRDRPQLFTHHQERKFTSSGRSHWGLPPQTTPTVPSGWLGQRPATAVYTPPRTKIH